MAPDSLPPTAPPTAQTTQSVEKLDSLFDRRRGDVAGERISASPRSSLRPASAQAGTFRPVQRPARLSTGDPPVVGLRDLPRGERARISRSHRFQLEYDVDPSQRVGIGRVELWYTDDAGRHWRRYGDDEDRQSPFLVELNREGVYGFRLVLHSADGLAGRPPRSGEPADMWVLADWTRPTVELTSARYGTGDQLGKLVIRWTARDEHLTQNPVSLSYSESPSGPWTSIASGLDNVGQYLWHVDDRVPRDFYLRIEVRDEAGNVALDQLSQPINCDGLAPQGRIRSVRPFQEDRKPSP